jgi:hypothetical protein
MSCIRIDLEQYLLEGGCLVKYLHQFYREGTGGMSACSDISPNNFVATAS